jgi:hypothetical protein
MLLRATCASARPRVRVPPLSTTSVACSSAPRKHPDGRGIALSCAPRARRSPRLSCPAALASRAAGRDRLHVDRRERPPVSKHAPLALAVDGRAGRRVRARRVGAGDSIGAAYGAADPGHAARAPARGLDHRRSCSGRWPRARHDLATRPAPPCGDVGGGRARASVDGSRPRRPRAVGVTRPDDHGRHDGRAGGAHSVASRPRAERCRAVERRRRSRGRGRGRGRASTSTTPEMVIVSMPPSRDDGEARGGCRPLPTPSFEACAKWRLTSSLSRRSSAWNRPTTRLRSHGQVVDVHGRPRPRPRPSTSTSTTTSTTTSLDGVHHRVNFYFRLAAPLRASARARLSATFDRGRGRTGARVSTWPAAIVGRARCRRPDPP